ncbi:hypothetical protein AVEN_126990-1 [Araneus ventricosus]|uniref:Uncharacterized protein n=1 Tax=Araneus ventricosus TaxID=182803 RepID=A0A4Y2C052_ARAVE|nr:hypothetical protein AVEN_126990-1 [Araneus ventricosus]
MNSFNKVEYDNLLFKDIIIYWMQINYRSNQIPEDTGQTFTIYIPSLIKYLSQKKDLLAAKNMLPFKAKASLINPSGFRRNHYEKLREQKTVTSSYENLLSATEKHFHYPVSV